MKLRRYKKRKIGSYFGFMMCVISVSFVFAFVIINCLAKRCYDILYPMAVSKTRKAVTMIINNACDDVLINNNLYNIVKDNDEIKMINYDTKEATRIINTITYNIQEEIKGIEDGNVIGEIPFGVIYDNVFLNNLGPKIKIHLNIIGDIMSNLETEVKPYGINNAYLEVRVSLKLTARVVLPFVTEDIVISNVIPISMNIVNGSVPDGYVYTYK